MSQDSNQPCIATPSVLTWARREWGLDIEEASRRADVPKEALVAHEQGDRPSGLTMGHLRSLAKVYRRQVAVFFFPEPPPPTRAAKDENGEVCVPWLEVSLPLIMSIIGHGARTDAMVCTRGLPPGARIVDAEWRGRSLSLRVYVELPGDCDPEPRCLDIEIAREGTQEVSASPSTGAAQEMAALKESVASYFIEVVEFVRASQLEAPDSLEAAHKDVQQKFSDLAAILSS